MQILKLIFNGITKLETTDLLTIVENIVISNIFGYLFIFLSI